MRQAWSERVKGVMRPALYRAIKPFDERYRCPICGYYGPFKTKRMSGLPGESGDPTKLVRRQSKCPRCASVERHRLQWLVMETLLPEIQPEGKSLLHIAPEPCLQDRLREAFSIYHTMDLFRTDVDFNEDVQRMSFEDGSYDVVFVSRVLSIPEDYVSSLREIRRVLRPGGVAVISEYLDRETTEPDPNPETEASWMFGVDFLGECEALFAPVVTRSSDEFDGDYQLINLFHRDGRPVDSAPGVVRAPGLGVKELLVLAYVGNEGAVSS